jgi:GNAT superfamily N-acetyltransferase
VIREYQFEDHPDIVEICKDIWDGTDYIPDTINFLKKDPTCYPTVLIDDNKVISVVNLRLFNKDIGWSEGMRTHPEYRGRGFASKLQEHQNKFAKELGCKNIWLSTAETNDATRKMLENMGFKEEAKFYLKNIKGTEKKSTQTCVEKIDISRATKILAKQEFPYVLATFKVFPIDSDYMKYYLNNLYAINNRTLLVIKESPERDSDLIVGFHGGSEDFEEAIEFAKSFNYETIKLFTPPNIKLDESRVFRYMSYEL